MSIPLSKVDYPARFQRKVFVLGLAFSPPFAAFELFHRIELSGPVRDEKRKVINGRHSVDRASDRGGLTILD